MVADRRRLALVLVLVLIAVAVVLTQMPFDAAGIRLGPLSLLWWYTGGAALAATLITLVVLATRAS